MKNLSVAVSVQTPLMVTGPNAAGKSSFFRVLGGLWPAQSGIIEVPSDKEGNLGIRDVFLVPQRIYMVLGTLADQILYPMTLSCRDQKVERRMQEVLGLVG